MVGKGSFAKGPSDRLKVTIQLSVQAKPVFLLFAPNTEIGKPAWEIHHCRPGSLSFAEAARSPLIQDGEDVFDASREVVPSLSEQNRSQGDEMLENLLSFVHGVAFAARLAFPQLGESSHSIRTLRFPRGTSLTMRAEGAIPVTPRTGSSRYPCRWLPCPRSTPCGCRPCPTCRGPATFARIALSHRCHPASSGRRPGAFTPCRMGLS